MFKPTRTSGDETQNDPKKKRRKIIKIAIGAFLLIGFLNFLSGGNNSKTNNSQHVDSAQPEAQKTLQNEQKTEADGSDTKPIEQMPKYEIIYRDNSTKTANLYIAIDKIDLTNSEYEKNIKNIVKYLSDKEPANIAMTFFDDKEFLKEYYQNTIGQKSSGISMENAVTFQKNKENIEKRSLHTIAIYSGNVQFDPYQISFFPAAFTDNKIVGKQVKTENFNPKDYTFNY